MAKDTGDWRARAAASKQWHTELRAAITARLDLARAATPGPWTADNTGTVCAAADLVVDESDGELILPADGPQEVAECYRRELPNERANNAAHIAANGPDAVIRLCEGALRMLDRHRIVAVGFCEKCARPVPCPDLQDLADGFILELAVSD